MKSCPDEYPQVHYKDEEFFNSHRSRCWLSYIASSMCTCAACPFHTRALEIVLQGLIGGNFAESIVSAASERSRL